MIPALYRISQELNAWFAVCSALIPVDFTHALQGCFTQTGAMVWVLVKLNLEEYKKITISHGYLLKTINSMRPRDVYMRQKIRPSLGKIMACRRISAKPLSEPMLDYCQLDLWEHILTFWLKNVFKMSSGKWRLFCLGLNVWLKQNKAIENRHLEYRL